MNNSRIDMDFEPEKSKINIIAQFKSQGSKKSKKTGTTKLCLLVEDPVAAQEFVSAFKDSKNARNTRQLKLGKKNKRKR